MLMNCQQLSNKDITGMAYSDLALKIHQLEEENRRLCGALAEVREVWAGSDACKCGGIVTETACEAYLQRLVKQCYKVAVDALRGSE